MFVVLVHFAVVHFLIYGENKRGQHFLSFFLGGGILFFLAKLYFLGLDLWQKN